jgi:hypothetical protein
MLKTRKEILDIVDKWAQHGAHLWYEEANSAAVALYGAKAGVFLGMTAALSQRRPVGHDIAHAMWAIDHPSLPLSAVPKLEAPGLGRLSGALPACMEAAALIRVGAIKHPSGPKVGAFSRALQLDPAEVVAVVDVHIARPLLGREIPTACQRRAVTEEFLAVGKGLWGPRLDDAACVRRAQAAFWHESATQSGWKGSGARGLAELSYARLIANLDGWWRAGR